jgi:hypothetical protein
MRKQNEEKSRVRNSVKAKRVYKTPRLVEFGSVAKLTAGSGNSLPFDTGTANRMMGA